MERIQMSIKDLSRLDILTKIKEGHFKQSKGAEILGVNPRQIRRLVQRLKLEGPKGVICMILFG
jgi:transcriptional regulator with GAF, ATPase, and Fis domain